jgi:hypothetical protein
MNEINKPIRIILCGTSKGINPQYLDLARATLGSIHLVDSDITNLHLIKLNELLTIKNEKYQLTNSGFIRVE